MASDSRRGVVSGALTADREVPPEEPCHAAESSLEVSSLLERIVEREPDVELPDLHGLSRASMAELERRLGLPRSLADRLEASFRLGRLVEASRLPGRGASVTPGSIASLVRFEVRGIERETFHGLYLDARHCLIERRCISVGTLTASLVHPREVLSPALSLSAAAFVVAHNHPSGDPEPSDEDLRVTNRLSEVGELMGIPLLDHVVVGHSRFVSLRHRGLLRSPPAGD